MTKLHSAKKSPAGAPGAKALITAASLAITLGGWAVLCLPLAIRWWPAAVIGLVAAVVARRRAALAAEAYAELVESAVDLHLARLLTVLDEPRPSPQQGRALTERLRRGPSAARVEELLQVREAPQGLRDFEVRSTAPVPEPFGRP